MYAGTDIAVHLGTDEVLAKPTQNYDPVRFCLTTEIKRDSRQSRDKRPKKNLQIE